MSKFLFLSCLVSVALVAGCSHGRVVAASNARDNGDVICTRFHYKLIGSGEYKYMNFHFRKYQPEVFDDDGISVNVSVEDTLKKDYEINQVNAFFSLMTLGIVPSVSKSHLHRRCVLSIAGRHVGSVEVCARVDEAGMTLPFMSFLVFSGDGTTCIPTGKKFVEHNYSKTSIYHYLAQKAMAYGIVSRLKEAEDSGLINERFVMTAQSAQSLSDAYTTRTKIQADAMARHGVASKVAVADGNSPFEIVRCDNERGKDFAYTFTLRRRGGGAATLSDYGVMRSAFRSMIRTNYASLHPDVNPRTLVIDFTEYALKGGVINGRVTVLTISPESLAYDSASRRGVVRVRIGEGQFEDARRWIRRNLVSLVNRRGIASGGDAIPQGARFYSEREEMRGGVLEVSFKTE